MFAIHAFGISLGILVTRIFILPIHDPERAIRPGLSADGTEPAVGGSQKIFVGGAFKARTGRREFVLIDRALMDVADENRAKPLRGILAALINVHSCEGGAKMLMVHNRRQQLIRIRIAGTATLPCVMA